MVESGFVKCTQMKNHEIKSGMSIMLQQQRPKMCLTKALATFCTLD